MRRKLQIWSHLLKKCLIENFIFCALTTERLLEVAIESCPEWDLNPSPLDSVKMI